MHLETKQKQKHGQMKRQHDQLKNSKLKAELDQLQYIMKHRNQSIKDFTAPTQTTPRTKVERRQKSAALEKEYNQLLSLSLSLSLSFFSLFSLFSFSLFLSFSLSLYTLVRVLISSIFYHPHRKFSKK